MFRQATRTLQCARLAATTTALFSTSSSMPGLFGISRLQSHLDFPCWAQEAKDRCSELVQHILSAPPDAAVVRMVDDISDTICQVYDSAECCRNIHPDPKWQQAAVKACQTLSEYLAEINHHEGLYNKLVTVQQAYNNTMQQQALQQQPGHPGGSLKGPVLSPQQLHEFCPETLVVTAKYRQDFEKFGIHLTDNRQRAEVARLLALNQHFPALFNAALADHKQLGTVDVPSRLMPSGWGVSPFLTGKVPVPLDSGNVHHFLSTTDNEEARRLVYLAGANAPAANVALLDQMLSSRHQLATLLGFSSYAAFKAADSTLAGTPAAAEGFLVDLLAGVHRQADQEVDLLTTLKRKHTGDAAAVLQPWDQEYYTRQLSSTKPHIKAAAAAAPYLQLGSVLDGLSQLLQQLMGLKLEQQPLAHGEGWAPGVLKLAVSCSDVGLLGYLYVDLLVRPGKVGTGGILYPLKCGRELPDGRYQQPVLCLVGNLSASTRSGRCNPTELLLTWREFKTLMHEMGHAVHSLVSRTRYQHVWGTRCSQDLVEVPSHLWEHFTCHQQSLALLARHKGSRDPLPSGLVKQLCKGGSTFSTATPALELQQQALLSLIDLMYHGALQTHTYGRGDLFRNSSVWHQLAAQHSSLPPPEGTQPQARFSHLTIYGASYYSYLYARCLSEALWQAHLAGDPLNPAAGEQIRKKLLEPGGGIDPLQLLTLALDGSDLREKVLLSRHNGWCPNAKSLLKSVLPT